MTTYAQQKAALTRAVKTKDLEKILDTTRRTVAEWNSIGAWPDDWARWQRAIDDAKPWSMYIDIQRHNF